MGINTYLKITSGTFSSFLQILYCLRSSLLSKSQLKNKLFLFSLGTSRNMHIETKDVAVQTNVSCMRKNVESQTNLVIKISKGMIIFRVFLIVILIYLGIVEICN